MRQQERGGQGRIFRQVEHCLAGQVSVSVLGARLQSAKVPQSRLQPTPYVPISHKRLMACASQPAPLDEAKPGTSVHGGGGGAEGGLGGVSGGGEADDATVSRLPAEESGNSTTGNACNLLRTDVVAAVALRVRQSVQSVPRSHSAVSAPGPPSSHEPSATRLPERARQESRHASKHAPLS